MQQKDFKTLLAEAGNRQPLKENIQQKSYIPLGELITPQGRLLADIDYVTRKSSCPTTVVE